MHEQTQTQCKIDLIGGVEGNSLFINDFRVAGNKPWGGERF